MFPTRPQDRIPFLADLSEEECNAFGAIAEERRFAAGDTIFAEGDRSHVLFVLVSGLVSFRERQRGGGDDVAMGTIDQAGEIFGISALVGEDHEYGVSAVCLEDTEVVAMGGEKLLALCARHADAGVKILRCLTAIMAGRLKGAREQLRSRIRPGLISHG